MPESEPVTGPAPDQREVRILVVDDDIIMAKSVDRLLSVLGFSSEFETDSRRALERIDSGSFDVLITDLRMPELSGVELCRAVRQLRPQLIPILMSANAATVSDEEHEEAAAILIKPFDPEEVRDVINTAISRRPG